MKKIVLTITAGLFALAAQAQQGSWYIGGNAGYNLKQSKVNNNGTEKDIEKTSSWSFSPEIGTFLSDNLQLGVALTIGGEKFESFGINTYANKSIRTGGTLYARYFFGSGVFRPFIGVNASVLPGSSNIVDSAGNTVGPKTKVMDLGVNLNAGFALALSSNVSVVGSFGAVGYNQSTSEASGTNVKYTTQSFGFENAGTLGQRFNVGIYYTFLK